MTPQSQIHHDQFIGNSVVPVHQTSIAGARVLKVRDRPRLHERVEQEAKSQQNGGKTSTLRMITK